MKHLSIYDIELKKAIFESNEIVEYEITSYDDSTEFDITTCDGVDFHIKLRNDIKYAISIMKTSDNVKDEKRG